MPNPRMSRLTRIAVSACFFIAATPFVDAADTWTVMVYMLSGDPTLECYALDNYQQLAGAVKANPDLNVLVEFQQPKNRCASASYSRNDYDWDGIRMFDLRKDLYPTKDLGVPVGGPMSAGSTLAEFVQWAKRKVPADHYALVLWGHGSGLAAAQLELEAQRKRRPEYQRAQSNCCCAITNGRGNLSILLQDPGSDGILLTRDVQLSLEALLASNKLDIVGFDACAMANVETAYAMRNVAHYMIASQDSEPICGWDYAEWLKATAGSDRSVETVARAAVSSYQKQEQCCKTARRSAQTPSQWFLSAIRLDNITAFYDAYNALAVKLTGTLSDSDNVKKITTVRSGFADFEDSTAKGLFIDLRRLLQELARSGPASVASDAGKLDSAFNLILANFASVDKGVGGNGLSIFFPETGDTFGADKTGSSEAYRCNPPGPMNLEWPCSGRRQWGTFLTDYYKSLP